MGGSMELGAKVVVLYDAGKGIITRFAEALDSVSPSLQRVVSSFSWRHSSGEGIASSEIVHFKDSVGVTQVSLIVLRQEFPTSACGRVVHELFGYLLSNAPIQSNGFSIIVPAILRMLGSTRNINTTSNAVNMYTAFVNCTSENTGTLSHLPMLPSNFALRDGFLAYMLHYAHATGLPTVLLVGPSTEGVAAQKKDSNVVLHAVGDVVGKQIGLSYSKLKLNNVTSSASPIDNVENDWRRLYI